MMDHHAASGNADEPVAFHYPGGSSRKGAHERKVHVDPVQAGHGENTARIPVNAENGNGLSYTVYGPLFGKGGRPDFRVLRSLLFQPGVQEGLWRIPQRGKKQSTGGQCCPEGTKVKLVRYRRASSYPGSQSRETYCPRTSIV